MKIGLIDVDLLDRKTSFPNLALMKISSSYKRQGEQTTLVLSYEHAIECDKLVCSKVFTESKEPSFVNVIDKPIDRGGTGYNLFNAPPLAENVEHSMPDYDLYRTYAENAPTGRNGIHTTAKAAYLKASIGFTTRGCFRRCPFCVNHNKTRVEKWSPVNEFYDESKPYIFLLDDNVLGYPRWKEIFDELGATGKKISYRQGLDIRVMTSDKAKTLEKLRYWKDVIFAFDNIDDKDVFERGANLYRENCNKETQVYCLTGFYKSGLDEVRDLVERVNVCKKYGFFPYIMRHEKGRADPYHDVFIQASRFYNQRSFSRNGDLVTFIKRYGSQKSQKLYQNDKLLQLELERLA